MVLKNVWCEMIFIYLKDGRRVDMPDAVSVIHRAQVVFLDKDGQIIRQLPTEEILAYSRVLYDEGNAPFRDHESRADDVRLPEISADALLLPRRRHRRSPRRGAAVQDAPDVPSPS